jgi:hypothetical protein
LKQISAECISDSEQDSEIISQYLKFDQISQKLDQISQKLDQISQKLDQISKNLTQIS